MSRTVLVTGGCGFIGSHLVRLLREVQPELRVVNLDKLTYAGSERNVAEVPEGEGYRFVRGDVGDPKLVEALLREERPGLIVHLAAESHVDRSILDSAPFTLTNVIGTQVLLEACRAFPPQTFLYVSTDEVYGDVGPDGSAKDEGAPLRPSNPYSASKAAADLMAQAYRRTYGLQVVVVRLCNNYGPRQYPEKLVPLMIRNLLQGNRLPVYGDGQQRRDWLYVADGTRALLAILLEGKPGCVYNVASRQERPNIEVVAALCRAFSDARGLPHESAMAQIEHVADRPGHDFRYAVDDTRLRSELGWQANVPFEEGMRRTVEWYLSNQAWLDSADTADYRQSYEAIYTQRWGRA